MGTANKVYVYQCDTCRRTVDLLNDGKHPDPVRCIITDKCRGRLSLTATRIGQPRLTPPVVGLDDRIKRGSVISEAVAQPTKVPVNLLTFGGVGGLTLAALTMTTDSLATTFTATNVAGETVTVEALPPTAFLPEDAVVTAIAFELTPEVLDFRHYMFTYTGSAATIEGQDSTPDRNLLRFNALSSKLRVYVNGIELPTTAYDRTVNDIITLTPTLVDSMLIIDVYVYKDVTLSFNEDAAVRLDFIALGATSSTDLAQRDTGSWGNVTEVELPDGSQRALLYCIDISGLDEHKSYGIARFDTTDADGNVQTLRASDLTLLFAEAPYAFSDKVTLKYLPCSTLVDDHAVLFFAVNEANGHSELSIEDSSVVKTFEPIKITGRVVAQLADPAAQETTPQRRHVAPKKYVLGPS